jgi:hypothetical protein
MMASDTELLRRAKVAYHRAPMPVEIIDQPSIAASEVVEHKKRLYVRLANRRGTLAVYRVRHDGMLRRLKRWPPAIEAR